MSRKKKTQTETAGSVCWCWLLTSAWRFTMLSTSNSCSRFQESSSQKGYYNRCFSDPPAEHDPFCDNIHSLHLHLVHILYLRLSSLLYSRIFGDFAKLIFFFRNRANKRDCRHLNYMAIAVFKNRLIWSTEIVPGEKQTNKTKSTQCFLSLNH